MAIVGDTLGARTGAAFKQILASQAKAYQGYGALLDELAQSKIEALDFVRKSFDLYVDAVGSAVSSAADVGKDVLETGMEKASTLARAAEQKIEQVSKVVASEVPAGARRAASTAKRTVKKTPPAP